MDMPTAAVIPRRRSFDAVKRSPLIWYVGPFYADDLFYADGPRRRTASCPDGRNMPTAPVGIDTHMPTAILRLRPALGRRHMSIYADGRRRHR